MAEGKALSDTLKLMGSEESRQISKGSSKERMTRTSVRVLSRRELHKRLSDMEERLENYIAHQTEVLESINNRSKQTTSIVMSMLMNPKNEDAELDDVERELCEIEARIRKEEGILNPYEKVTLNQKETLMSQEDKQVQAKKKMPTWMKLTLAGLTAAGALGGSFAVGKRSGIKKTEKDLGLDSE